MFVREIILMYVIQPDFKTSSDPLSPAVWARPDCVRTSSAPLVCLTHHRCNKTNAVCNFCFPSAVHVVSESCRHVCCSCLSERCLLHLQNGRCNFSFVCVAGLNVSLWVNDWDCLLIKKTFIIRSITRHTDTQWTGLIITLKWSCNKKKTKKSDTDVGTQNHPHRICVGLNESRWSKHVHANQRIIIIKRTSKSQVIKWQKIKTLKEFCYFQATETHKKPSNSRVTVFTLHWLTAGC